MIDPTTVPATARNMPASRYGAVPVRTIDVDSAGQVRDLTVWYTMADLLGRGMVPRPFYSERRRMDRMGPTRLGVHLILRRVYFGLPVRVALTWPVRWLWRHA